MKSTPKRSPRSNGALPYKQEVRGSSPRPPTRNQRLRRPSLHPDPPPFPGVPSHSGSIPEAKSVPDYYSITEHPHTGRFGIDVPQQQNHRRIPPADEERETSGPVRILWKDGKPV